MRVKLRNELKVVRDEWAFITIPPLSRIRHTIIISLLLAVLMYVGTSCAVVKSDSITKIALLAPFEGLYREIGYNALYSVRLALEDSDIQNIHLLAVDDGGSIDSALNRTSALNIDPDVQAIIVLGPFASSADVQQKNNKPLVIVGYWGDTLVDDDAYHVINPDMVRLFADGQNKNELANDMALLHEVTPITDGAILVSAGSLPDEAFRERYINSNQFVPEPNLLATLTYDVTNMIIESLSSNTRLAEQQYSGINGVISFSDGYWDNAEIHRYTYEDDKLVAYSP